MRFYAHAPTGGIPASLCPHDGVFLTGTAKGGPTWDEPEAGVTNGAGQLLFHVGNSGNSSEPHLHVHITDSSGNWSAMGFDRGQTTPFDGNSASLDVPWTPLKGTALPMATVLVWPKNPPGNWTYNGVAASAFQGGFNHFVDSGEMADTIGCHDSGATYDSSWVPAKGYWLAFIGISKAEHTLKNATFGAQGFSETSVSSCGDVMAAVWRRP